MRSLLTSITKSIGMGFLILSGKLEGLDRKPVIFMRWPKERYRHGSLVKDMRAWRKLLDSTVIVEFTPIEHTSDETKELTMN